MSDISRGAAWRGVPSPPTLHAAPTAMASLLGHGISAALIERMLSQPHLRERLDLALSERLGPLPAEMTDAQITIMALNTAGLTRLALRAGAAWHAHQIAKVYDGQGVRTLVERIGPEFRDVALADLAARDDRLSEPRPVEVAAADLPGAIARDGTACLVAWSECQPRPVGWRVLLRTRITARPGPEHASAGPAVIDRVAVLMDLPPP